MEQSSRPRKFNVEPIETTIKKAPRKFAPEPIETTSKTSKKTNEEPKPIESSSSSGRKFLPEPIETTQKSSKKTPASPKSDTKPPRKFAPEPVETTSRSSRAKEEAADSSPPKRRFLPQPIETTHTSSKETSKTSQAKSGPRKFAPQLVDGSTEQRSSKKSTVEDRSNSQNVIEERRSSELSIIELPTRRKFSPDLIDTAKRTRRAGDLRPAHLPSDRTDSIPEAQNGVRRPRKVHFPAQPENTPISSSLPSPALSSAECRRLGIPVPKRQTSTSSLRQHSFRAPSLEPIDSSESGEDSDGASSDSSHSSSSDMSYQMYQHATRMRESVDATSRGYLLELAAKAADRQLREQADAAFPNSDRHVRVDHYIGHDQDDSISTSRSTRSEQDQRRFGSVNWELKDLRAHAEFQEANKERERAAREARRKWNKEYEQKCGPWRNPFKNQVTHKTDHKDNAEMQRMRKQARPPMLGGDIEFPRCPSPEPARFDVTQGTYNERTAMCYLTEHAGPGPCGEGLWAVRPKKSLGVVTIVSPAESRSPSPTGSTVGGLWGGFCKGKAGHMSPPRGPTGILTPAVMDEITANPFEALGPNSHMHQLPPSPPPSNSGMASLDEKLELTQSMEAEFTDDFVTQVFNYLSLGYPSIARRFDDELAKITRTPVSELRQDDELESSRGYIRFGEDGNNEEEGIKEEMSARWKALKAYIHEWARQQPGFQEPTNYGGFGVTVRRGSWAW